jgi:hypothetical protein
VAQREGDRWLRYRAQPASALIGPAAQIWAELVGARV